MVSELPAALQPPSDWPETVGEARRPGKTVFGILQRRRAWIVLTIMACVAVAALITLLKPPTYEAAALLIVDQRATAPSADLNATISTGELLAAHYVKMAQSVSVLNPVCAEASGGCTYKVLKDHVTTATVKGTDLLAVRVSDPSPARAAVLANLVAEKLMAEERAEVASALQPTKAYLDGELARLHNELTTTTKPQLLSVVQAQYDTVYTRRAAVAEQEARLDGALAMAEGAQVPSTPADPDPKRYLAAGLAIGVVLALIIALVVDRIDDRIFTGESLADATEAPLVVAC